MVGMDVDGVKLVDAEGEDADDVTGYFDEPVDTRPIEARGDVRALLSANGAAILLLGILPGGLMALCVRAIVQALTT